jgi:ribose transport system ATP-binding protein
MEVAGRMDVVNPGTAGLRPTTLGAAPKPDEGQPPAILKLSGIEKRFGGIYALRGVDFELRRGEVHALLGENGAGKSTLMNVIAGVITEYAGSIVLDGREVRFGSPAAAQSAGIAMIFQELDLVPGLSIAENLFMGREPGRLGFVNQTEMRAQGDLLLDQVGLRASSRQLVESLRIGERQLVAIAKALSLRARILVMDEPTAALASSEVARLFGVVRELRAQGVSIVFISHRLEEVPLVADRVTVLRDGEVVGTVDASAPQSTLVQMQVGRLMAEFYPPRSQSTQRADVLRLERFGFSPRLRRSGYQRPIDLTLTVREGEIVGLAGLLGAGRTELLELLYGAGPAGVWSGTMEIDGHFARPRSVDAARRLGIALVTDDRRASGYVPQLSVGRNLVLNYLRNLSRFGFVLRSRERPVVSRVMQQFSIRASSPDAPITSLSGGNQQKVVLGKSLVGSARLLLLDEPTRGVDVGAKAEIYRLLRGLASDGLAVLVTSSEIPELIGLCDRIYVLREGRTVAELPSGVDEDVVLSWAGVRLRERVHPVPGRGPATGSSQSGEEARS